MIPWYTKWLAVAILVAISVVACHKRDERLVGEGVQQEKVAEAKLKAQYDAAIEKKEIEFNNRMNEIASSNFKEREQHEALVSDLQHRIVAGELRLRIATVRPSAPAQGQPTAPSPEPEEGSVVVPEVASDILGIAGSISQDVRDYNDLLDAYHALESACTKGVNTGLATGSTHQSMADNDIAGSSK